MPKIIYDNIFTTKSIQTICDDYARVVIVTDSNVGPLYALKLNDFLSAANITVDVIEIAAGEAQKNRETKAYIEDCMFALGCGRDCLLIGLGGGVITDISGFVAATYYRGVDIVYIPTTLMAMVDAAIGGKTAVNCCYGKNLIGAFSDPIAIIIDIKLLQTLSRQHFNEGCAEIIKHAIIKDVVYFDYLLSNIMELSRNEQQLKDVIQRSCDIKNYFVSSDKYDKDRRQILNFGHTIAHAVEVCSDFRISHGMAVMIGIVVESYISHLCGHLSFVEFNRIKDLILRLESNFSTVDFPAIEDIIAAMTYDKKNAAGLPRFILLEDIAKLYYHNNSYLHTVEPHYIYKSLEYFITEFQGMLC